MIDAKRLERDLKKILGDGFTNSAWERSFYRRDLLQIPFSDRLLRTMPDAVASPANADQVSGVLKYCSDETVAVTPRGAGSSALFGAVPKKGGIVLDLRALSGNAAVDAENESVRAPAGMTWLELEHRLNKCGMTLMTYPSSAPSATLGGWAATTGLGIGNLRYGPLEKQVQSAHVVLPDGTQRDFERGEGLDEFMGSEGLLGVITEIKLMVRSTPPFSLHQLLSFPGIGDLNRFVQEVASLSALPYALEFYDSGYVDMLRRAGYPVELGGGCLALVSLDGEDRQVQEAKITIEGIASVLSGKAVSGGEEEWNQRFKMLRVRRAVPALTMGSFHLPVNSFAGFAERASCTAKSPFGIVGHLVSRTELVLMILSQSPSDRGLGGLLGLARAIELSELALSLGGFPGGGLGLWNSAYRNRSPLGIKAESTLVKKKEVDPKGILNPGLWHQPPVLLRPSVMRLAAATGGLASALLKKASSPRKALSELDACVQCGYCMEHCPTRGRWPSSTPKGRVTSGIALCEATRRKAQLDATAVGGIFECTLCGRCRVGCSVDIKSPEMWADLRTTLVGAGSGVQSLDSLSQMIVVEHNLSGKPNAQRGKWAESLRLERLKPGAEVAYFVGCVTSFYPMVQDVARSFARILDKAGIDFTVLGGEEWCCGYPLLSAGHSREAVEHMRRNIDRMKQLGVKKIFTACPGCLRMWTTDFKRLTGEDAGFEVKHSAEVIAGLLHDGRIAVGETNARVTYHDPCDLGRNAGIYDQPRYILSKVAGVNFVEMEANRELCNCCGSGGDLLAANEKMSLGIASKKIAEIRETQAEVLVTACPSCLRAINMARLAEKAPFKVLDITQMTWNALIKEQI